MASKRVQINKVVKDQLPDYVREENPLVGEFLSAYYQGQEYQGGPIDIINNLDSYIQLNKGDNIFTPSLEIHATHFPVKTTLIVCSKNKRNKTIYEKDTVRVKFINLNNYQSYINIKK